MGNTCDVTAAAMLQVADATGDTRFQDYTFRNFGFIFTHLPYFKRQAAQFGPQNRGYGRMLDMRELDHCGAIGAALVKANAQRPDPRYQEGIDLTAAHIMTKQLRLPDGTLARPRPVPVALWIDDAYMSIPFLAQMGKMTGEARYFDDAAQQVIGMSARLFDPSKGLFDHSWFANMEEDARFYWQVDLKSGLEKLADSLGAVVWIESLGSMRDKCARVSALVDRLGREWHPADWPMRREVALRAARLARDTFGGLSCYGVVTLITFQAMVNIGVNLRMIPATGLTLPFVSYGGSSLLSPLLGVGLVQSVILRHRSLEF